MSPRRQTLVDENGAKVRCDRCGSSRSVKVIRDKHGGARFHACTPCRKRLLSRGYELIAEVQ